MIIVGMGVQGVKRRAVAGSDVVATVDPIHSEATHRSLTDVPLGTYDAALVCTPDEVKIELLTYLLSNGKHLLVEKPLFATDGESLKKLKRLASSAGVVCYTAYNHRFEPHFVRMKETIDSGRLGKIYCARLFYGNGTARLVRESAWRDQGAGVLPDLGSHLLDTVLYWFGRPKGTFAVYSASRFENKAPDHVSFGIESKILLQLETTLLSWRNHFYADIFAEYGSAHIQSLCKWGPSTFTLRDRKLPSGYPIENSLTIRRFDPTWGSEYEYFKSLCKSGGEGNIKNDIWINSVLTPLISQISTSIKLI